MKWLMLRHNLSVTIFRNKMSSRGSNITQNVATFLEDFLLSLSLESGPAYGREIARS